MIDKRPSAGEIDRHPRQGPRRAIAEVPRAPRNRTLRLTRDEVARYQGRLVRLAEPAALAAISNRTICQDLLEAVDFLPAQFVDLLVIDPPYNKTKDFRGTKFSRLGPQAYVDWLESWFSRLLRAVKPTATVYICSDWASSAAVSSVAEKYLVVRNRITWEREKGRGAVSNWKNCSEDIWFCTVGDSYTFNVDAVKMKRKVLAPYTDDRGAPKDWDAAPEGNFRLTHPSNLWFDITVPFWSMRENTDHPTQKPEKLLAKLILASSNAGDVVLDPFLGSGTTSVVAKKLARQYVGIERECSYCCLAEKRLELAETDNSIQGYQDGVFWERNSRAERKHGSTAGAARNSNSRQTRR
jgi:site-specific DNA-methyltransferase (adenine-specific)